MTAQPATLAYTVVTPDRANYEIWTAPVREGQLPRWAIVRFPTAAHPRSAAVELYRGYVNTAVRCPVTLDQARFVARCHVGWPHPDDAGSIVVFASTPAPTDTAAEDAAYRAQAERNREEDGDDLRPLPVGLRPSAFRRALRKE